LIRSNTSSFEKEGPGAGDEAAPEEVPGVGSGAGPTFGTTRSVDPFESRRRRSGSGSVWEEADGCGSLASLDRSGTHHNTIASRMTRGFLIQVNHLKELDLILLQ
jgi:hypothetical protein